MMIEACTLPLKVVDGRALPDAFRAVLRPGETLVDEHGRERTLPVYFYEIDSWKTARDLELAPEMSLWEFINVDVREADVMLGFPRYIPCAVSMLAACLSVFRVRVGTLVHIAANGGYRTPAHEIARGASRHLWGTAANIYRIGGDVLDNQDIIAHYANIAREVFPAFWVRPFGNEVGQADDHLHLDIGYVTVEPNGVEAGETGA